MTSSSGSIPPPPASGGGGTPGGGAATVVPAGAGDGSAPAPIAAVVSVSAPASKSPTVAPATSAPPSASAPPLPASSSSAPAPASTPSGAANAGGAPAPLRPWLPTFEEVKTFAFVLIVMAVWWWIYTQYLQPSAPKNWPSWVLQLELFLMFLFTGLFSVPLPRAEWSLRARQTVWGCLSLLAIGTAVSIAADLPHDFEDLLRSEPVAQDGLSGCSRR